MKIALILILLIHGIIHFMVFSKVFHLAEVNQVSQNISKPIGMIWLLFIFFLLLATAHFFLKKDWWFIVAILTVIISQTLIIIYWKDAKFGTIANIIILVASLQGYGNFQFNKRVQKESLEILKQSEIKNVPIISESNLQGLPEIVKKWLRFSGIVGKEKIMLVRLEQEGQMKIKPFNNWIPFTAKQYFNVAHPAFIWTTNVDFIPMVKLAGRDKFRNGEGEMLIKLTSLIPVVNEDNNEKVNQAAMVRYLAEIIWFPSAALENYIKWIAIDETSAMAIFKLNEKTTSGIFKFSENGEMKSFEAERYYGSEKDAALENWLVKALDYKNFNGVTIPNKCEVIWKLKEGDFNWLNLEITQLEYNIKTN